MNSNSQIQTFYAAAESLYILITGAIASGKTTLWMNLSYILAELLKRSPFAFDKDYLVGCTESGFAHASKYAGKPIKPDRQSQEFYDFYRNQEYLTTEKITLECGLRFNPLVLCNAPYTSEIRREGKGEVDPNLRRLYEGVHKYNANLVTIFLSADRETVKRNLEKRQRDDPEAAARTPEIYDDIDRFLDGQNLTPPEHPILSTDGFFVFDSADSDRSWHELLHFLHVPGDTAYDPDIIKHLS